MSIVVGTDSYASIDEAAAYFAARLNSSKWTAATDSDKEASLKQATRMLDDFVAWFGILSVEDQPLAWPRTGAIDKDARMIPSDEIPSAVKRATFEQALHLLSFDPTQPQELTVKGFSSASGDAGAVTADKSARPDMLASLAIAAILHLGDLQPGATVGGARSATLERA